MELISREALLEALKKSRKHHAQNGRELELLCRCENIVNEQPTVEAITVVRGEWVLGDLGEWKCSICSEENCYAYDENLKRFTDFFCPNCGADMRKKV